MQFDDVVIASKKTPMDYYEEEHEDVAEALPDDEYEAVLEGYENHYGTLGELEELLEEEGVAYDVVHVFPGMDEPERDFDT
ncbi:MAG: hypothetical protein SVU32_05780, partial [Candidatus Nanohaloarchaea archaeon]|nr:hypothetical protein [Candidatus Nanohaloarchaea archaeon]